MRPGSLFVAEQEVEHPLRVAEEVAGDLKMFGFLVGHGGDAAVVEGVNAGVRVGKEDGRMGGDQELMRAGSTPLVSRSARRIVIAASKSSSDSKA